MDVRDPWVGWYHTQTSYYGPTRCSTRFRPGCFRRCVRQASMIVHNTERLRLLTCQLAPDVTAKTRCVSERHRLGVERTSRRGAAGRFRIGYYGQVMGRRNPSAFLQGLRSWLDSRRENPNVEVCFFGSGFGEIRRQAKGLGLDGCVALSSQLPRADVPAEMAKDFALLLVANEQPLRVFPGRPRIPGRCPEDPGAHRQGRRDGRPLNRSQDADRRDPTEIQAALDDLYRQYEAGSGAWVDRGSLIAELQYSRRVERFAEFIHDVVKR